MSASASRAILAAGAAEARELLEPAEAEQLGLFVDMLTQRAGESEAAFAERRAKALERAKRGPGRPPGSENATSKAMRELLLRFGPNPLISAQKVHAMGWATLAEELNTNREEAFKLWWAIVRDLMPFFGARLAPVDERGVAVPSIALVVGGDQVNAATPGRGAPWDRGLGEVLDLQPLSGAEDPPSQISPSQVEEK